MSAVVFLDGASPAAITADVRGRVVLHHVSAHLTIMGPSPPPPPPLSPPTPTPAWSSWSPPLSRAAGQLPIGWHTMSLGH